MKRLLAFAICFLVTGAFASAKSYPGHWAQIYAGQTRVGNLVVTPSMQRIFAAERAEALARHVRKAILPNAAVVGPIFGVLPADIVGNAYTVHSQWVHTLGCISNQNLNNGPYSDPACGPNNGGGDVDDSLNWGLLMNKTGPSAAAGTARVKFTNVDGRPNVSELGYDIRKGSECDADPLYVITTETGNAHGYVYVLACKDMVAVGPQSPGWARLRAAGCCADNSEIESASLVLDIGTDTSQGFAILDNFDISGRIQGDPGDTGVAFSAIRGHQ